MKNNHEFAKTNSAIKKNDLTIKWFVKKAIDAAKKNNFKLAKNYLKKIDTKIIIIKKKYQNLLLNDLEDQIVKQKLLTIIDDHFFSVKVWKLMSKEIVNLYILVAKN